MKSKAENHSKGEEDQASPSNSIDGENFSIEQLAAKAGGATTAKVLDLLEDTVNYQYELARRLGKKPQSINYHIKKLKDLGLIRKVGFEESNGKDKIFFTATAKGEKALEKLDVPDTETVKKNYYGGDL